MLPKDRIRTAPKVPEKLPEIGTIPTKIDHLNGIPPIQIPDKIDLSSFQGVLRKAHVLR